MQNYLLKKIWDPLTRLWHWVLAVVVSLGWYFGEYMSFTFIDWHFYCGYAVLGLLAVRLIWGFIGPKPIRFSSLFTRPSVLIAYARTLGKRSPSGTPGHNPLGSLSVLALLLLLAAQALSGLFIESDVFFEAGPLAHLVTESTMGRMAWWHELLAQCILVMVVLHVAAIFYYWLWKKENLITPMITGWKWVKRVYLSKDENP
ncbi:cytochrome b/b6 domain-containing protein [Dasania sp. GY-MA-18]|uniref:Cytochrome b/b6 domain-containing protein n=1 Tax=Dasania phycosphaerae TaxID=2950436 RepID=A0A9J6RND9_9GAMM|nr:MULTISPECIES: cytochrome b/b6 domain-containing protein [Dasania]MCR8923812.1 cytochrome b/b6 domain-containing protein [Dasania sp. GY-MA-18]MCZ0866246.1 cytochrome b/b6 domain-containing protein [Dasania phycosphaerae]MCZ0869970.1 cytochrome b/b6 domain-containing protein [Dasania phycosphaerae]